MKQISVEMLIIRRGDMETIHDEAAATSALGKFTLGTTEVTAN